jgi:hypothetical protein
LEYVRSGRLISADYNIFGFDVLHKISSYKVMEKEKE